MPVRPRLCHPRTSCQFLCLKKIFLTGAGPVSGAPNEVVQPSDGRASLLESIRNAGGVGKAKLRNVKERKMEKKKQKEQEQGVWLMQQHGSTNC